ncbi:MAG: uroporphyrinogen-III synthase [Balneolaceae bacterium]
MKTILITSETTEASTLNGRIPDAGWELLPVPLEQYRFRMDPEQREALRQQIDTFRFVVYGGVRHVQNFLIWADKSGIRNEILQKIHLAMNQPEVDLLEDAGIPGILPREGARPIDLMEFMLRINQSGGTLYPCADGSSEEMPGLLQELDLPVSELTVCEPVPLEKNQLRESRQIVHSQPPDAILFHSRGSVIRTKTAFPELDLKDLILISASAGVTQKMYQEGLQADHQAEGSWDSVVQIIQSLN